MTDNDAPFAGHQPQMSNHKIALAIVVETFFYESAFPDECAECRSDEDIIGANKALIVNHVRQIFA